MNKDKKDFGAQLAYAALDDVPTPKANAKEIVGLVKSGGRISGYQRELLNVSLYDSHLTVPFF